MADRNDGYHRDSQGSASGYGNTGAHRAQGSSGMRGAHYAEDLEQPPTAQGVQPVRPAHSARQQRGAHASGARADSGARANGPHYRVPQDDQIPSPQKPRGRKRSARDILSTALIVVGIVLLVGAGVVVVRALLGYREAASVYEEIESAAVNDQEGVDYPSVDFEVLESINADIVGWIYIPGTQINYPVVQTDDNSTYLTKLFDDTSNTSGTIFMDMDDTAPGLVDMQTTLYGHHMNDGSMFKFIDNTLDQDDFDTVEVVYYITAEATYVLKPLFTVQVDETYLDVRAANFTSTTILRTYLRTLLSQASAVADDAEERIAETEQVLSLVTCAGEIIPRTTRAVMICTIEEVIYSE